MADSGPKISTKAIIAIVALGVVTCFVLVFWMGRLSVEQGTPLDLAPGIDAQISKWTSGNVPMNQRAVTLVFGDTGAEKNPLEVPEGEVYVGSASGDQPSAVPSKKKGGLAKEHNKLVKIMSQAPDVVAWTFDGFSKAKEEDVAKKIAETIVKAHDAGAEINVVTQRDMIAVVLKALKTLEGVKRGGAQVGVNKVVAMGMSRARLKKVASFYPLKFGGGGSVLELTNVYLDKSNYPPTAEVELSNARNNGTQFHGSYIVLGSAAGGATVSNQVLANAILQLAQSIKSLEETFKERQEGASNSKPKEPAKPRQFRALLGTTSKKGGGKASVPSQPADQKYPGQYKYESTESRQKSSLDFIAGEKGSSKISGGSKKCRKGEELRGINCSGKPFNDCLASCNAKVKRECSRFPCIEKGEKCYKKRREYCNSKYRKTLERIVCAQGKCGNAECDRRQRRCKSEVGTKCGDSCEKRYCAETTCRQKN